MRKNQLALAALAALGLAGCAGITPTREISSGYAIFDVMAGPDIGSARIVEAIKVALQKHMSQVQIVHGIPPSPLPEKAPRFQLVSPFKGSNLGALAAASGQSLQVPTCDGAILTANARDTSMARYGEGTTFFACLMPYQGGYALNVYTTFTKASGAFSAATLGATLARTVVGDSSQFLPRIIAQMVEGVKGTGASVTLVQAYP
jgi:outer membrane lipoprotein SlyB